MKQVNFKPLNGYLLVIIPKISEKTPTGIIKSQEMLEEEKKKNDDFLTIAAIDDKNVNMKVGDKILINSSNATLIEIDGVNYGLISQHNVIGVRIK